MDKEQPGGDLGVTVSITLCRSLIPVLVDEFRLFEFPVVLSRGGRLFPEGTGLGSLELVDATTFKSGTVLITYRKTPLRARPDSSFGRSAGPYVVPGHGTQRHTAAGLQVSSPDPRLRTASPRWP